ncbi:MAG: PadR family transcriptional regulator [Aeropyrum sp.]|nr:PadR family transcriptional regulator [Aeropyrum sp.]MCE4615449.1 PadR family transcriptional regulator [Aeropyrum sp.]
MLRDVEVHHRSNIVRDSLRQIVLRILAEQPYHGYDIMRRVGEITGGMWKPAPGTLYPLLDQMKEEGLIEVVRVDNEGVKGGRKIVYGLTEKGWTKLVSILLEKAGSKIDFLIYYIVEGCVVLRSKGYKDEAESICSELRKSVKRLIDSLNEYCPQS